MRFDLDQFERSVVLRVSRGVYLAMAGTAALLLAGSLVALAYGLAPAAGPAKPPRPAVVQPTPVTSESLLAAITPSPARSGAPARPGTASARRAASASGERPEEPWPEVAAWKATIADRFDTGGPPWLDRVEVSCVQRDWMNRCLRHDRRVLAVGAGTTMNRILEGRSAAEQVTLLETLDGWIALADGDDAERATHMAAAHSLAERWRTETGTPLHALIDAFGSDRLAPQVRSALPQVAGRLPAAEVHPAVFVAWSEWLLPLADELETLDVAEAARVLWVLACQLPATAIPDAAGTLDATFPSLAPSQRAEAVEVLAALHERAAAEARASQERARAAWEQEVSALTASRAQAAARKADARRVALGGGGLALALLAMLGLVLAVLAVERNTRALRELAAPVRARGAA